MLYEQYHIHLICNGNMINDNNKDAFFQYMISIPWIYIYKI